MGRGSSSLNLVSRILLIIDMTDEHLLEWFQVNIEKGVVSINS
jgi:hypothetical protein